MSDERSRIYLLDASTYIFRAFHSTQPRDGSRGFTNSQGLPTNALLVFTNMLRKLIRDHKITEFACVFDHSGKSFRNDQYEKYKANRKETPPDLVLQFPYFRPIVAGLGVKVVEKENYEADDVIATLAKQIDEAGREAVIVSSDKDLYQLLNDNVHMYDSMKDRWIDLEAVHKKFGVDPRFVTQVQGFIGDSVDNIPGVPGIGPKTAAKLINEYDDLEGVYDNIESLKGKLKENLETYKDDAFMSRDLATLVTDVSLGLNTDEFVVNEPDKQKLTEIFTELEFKTLLRDYHTDVQERPESVRKTVTTPTELTDLGRTLESAKRFAVELVTNGDRVMQSEITGIAFATSGHQSWYVPIAHRYLGAPAQLPLENALTCVKPLLESPQSKTIAHGWKETAIVLRNAGVALAGVLHDTEIGSFVANPTKYTHTLDNIALDRLGLKLPTPPKPVVQGKESWSQVSVDTAAEFAQSRAEAVFQSSELIEKELNEAKSDELNNDIELPLGRVLADMEIVGVRVDPKVLNQLSARFADVMSNVEKAAFGMAEREFNMGSPKQLADVLFNRLGLPIIKKTKTGASTDASVLEQLADKHPIIGLIHEWREVQKLKGTYTDVLPTLINPKTGRIHTTFRQAVAATGRLSSFDPNLQNIPIRSAEGRRIRDAFIAGEGCQLVSADYSQVELRILAHLTGDPGLQKAFIEGKDIHRQTASEIFEVPEADITREQRSAAKAINFGLMYGMGPFRLARDLKISRKEATDYIQRYFARFSAVKSFMDSTVEFGKQNGYVETVLGRRRYVPDLNSGNHMRRSGAERVAINTPVQGSAADIIKLAMLKIDTRLAREQLKTKMVLQVHDELVFDAPEEEVETIKSLVKEEMEQAYPLSVPLTVECASGYNWNEAH